MQRSPMGKSFLRVAVSLFVAMSVVSAFQLSGLTLWLVFIGVYYGVSQLFFYAADQLEEGHSRNEANPKTKTPSPNPWEATQTKPIEALWLEPKLSETLCQAIPEVSLEELSPSTQFSPIAADESTTSHFDRDNNLIHVTQTQFQHWLRLLAEQYQVSVPPEKLNQWALNTNLGEIGQWLALHAPPPRQA